MNMDRLSKTLSTPGLGCRLLEEPGKKPSKHLWCAISCIRRKEIPWGIVTKFCLWVDIQDVITYTTFGDDPLRGFGVARGWISRFPIDLSRRPYNTLVLPCECVISILFLWNDFYISLHFNREHSYCVQFFHLTSKRTKHYTTRLRNVTGCNLVCQAVHSINNSVTSLYTCSRLFFTDCRSRLQRA